MEQSKAISEATADSGCFLMFNNLDVIIIIFTKGVAKDFTIIMSQCVLHFIFFLIATWE